MRDLDKITEKIVLVLGRPAYVKQFFIEFSNYIGPEHVFMSYEPPSMMYYQDYPDHITKLMVAERVNKFQFISSNNKEFIEMMVRSEYPLQVVTMRGKGDDLHPCIRSKESAREMIDLYEMELRV